MRNSSQGWNVVLSFGDLSVSSGYRTRILGELEYLDPQTGLEPFLLVFDRDPEKFKENAPANVASQAFARSAVPSFYSELSRLEKIKPVRMIHAHNLYSAAIALSARPRHKYSVILDYHGRIPEEYVYLGKGGRTSRRVLETLERWSVRRSNEVIVVSEKLAAYLENTYGIARSKITVIPCCTDSHSFRWDAGRRTNIRHRLGLENRFVCVHLGSFFEWYDPDLLVDLFSRIRSGREDAHLLVVTPSATETREHLSKQFDSSVFTVTSAAHEEIPGLLNASDLGFLLLRSAPNIRTSSPVKFAEYLNCGVPVAITPDVGDCSDLVKTTHTGFIFDPANRMVDNRMVRETRTQRDSVAERCLSAGRRLTWEAVARDATPFARNQAETP